MENILEVKNLCKTYIVDKRQKQLNLEEIEDRQKELEKQLEKLLKENEVTLGQIS